MYQVAYNTLTDNRDVKLRKYTLEDSEWQLDDQLASVLKVRSHTSNFIIVL